MAHTGRKGPVSARKGKPIADEAEYWGVLDAAITCVWSVDPCGMSNLCCEGLRYDIMSGVTAEVTVLCNRSEVSAVLLSVGTKTLYTD